MGLSWSTHTEITGRIRVVRISKKPRSVTLEIPGFRNGETREVTLYEGETLDLTLVGSHQEER